MRGAFKNEGNRPRVGKVLILPGQLVRRRLRVQGRTTHHAPRTTLGLDVSRYHAGPRGPMKASKRVESLNSGGFSADKQANPEEGD